MAIARADCPPDCGGGPGNGGMPSGPPGGGTEFVPPSIPAMPSYDPGRGQPPLDQNNGISIYNSAAPQPSQAAQPSQAPVQNQDGSYSRASNGEQQPINHNAPNNQELNNNWQKLSDQLNQQNQPGQENQQQQSRNKDCESIAESIESQRGAVTPTAEQIEQARQEIVRNNQRQVEEFRKNGVSIRVNSEGTITISNPTEAGIDEPDATVVLEYARDRVLSDRAAEAISAAGLTGQCTNSQPAAAPLKQYRAGYRGPFKQDPDPNPPFPSRNAFSYDISLQPPGIFESPHTGEDFTWCAGGPANEITIADVKEELTRPGGFGQDFPIPGHPDNFPKKDDAIPLHMFGQSFPVQVTRVEDTPQSFGFEFITLPGHVDGPNSIIRFQFVIAPNGVLQLNIHAEVAQPPIADWLYTVIARNETWPPFINNVAFNILLGKTPSDSVGCVG